jgi:phenylpropionate dioxygenase-like ring-hydroxylating dioxygenase large terminal subunit
MSAAPPSFEAARTRRQRVRAAGLDPDRWYAAEYEAALRPGQVVGATFWETPIAIYRDAAGGVHALEDRCAHRQLRLSLGTVSEGCLACPYHGWSYGPDGRLASVPHDLFGHPMPSVSVRAFPVRLRYGLIWVFPGDPARAGERTLPALPELDGPDPWAYVPLGYTWRAHHSMVIDNLCDLTHAHLHRRFPAFHPGRLLDVKVEADRVVANYEARVGPFGWRRRSRPQVMEIAYEYPYHRARFEWSGVEGRITYWTFLLPIDRSTTRVFFMFCYDRLRIGGLPVTLGHRALRAILRAGHPLFVHPIMEQDRMALEAEQHGWDAHWEAPAIELNPVVGELHDLTIRQWSAHLARAGAGRPAAAGALATLRS